MLAVSAVARRQPGTAVKVIPGQVERAGRAEVEPRRRPPALFRRPRGGPARPRPADHLTPAAGLACEVWRVSGVCDHAADVRLEVSDPTRPGMWDLCDGHARQLLDEAQRRGVRVYVHEWHSKHAPPGRYEITRHQPYRRLQFAPQPRSDYAPTVTGPFNDTLEISGGPRPKRAVTFF